MTSILNLTQESSPDAQTITTDYEIVLGRAQIASWLFVGVMVVAVSSSLAYLAGEYVADRKAGVHDAGIIAPAPIPPPPPVSAPISVPLPEPLPQASIFPPTKPDVAALAPAKPAPPLFAQPVAGKIYLQVSAVDKGMAMIVVEGLRSRGFESFAAPGPNEKIYRVLIGPLPNPQSFRQAMLAINAFDLAPFPRKYQK